MFGAQAKRASVFSLPRSSVVIGAPSRRARGPPPSSAGRIGPVNTSTPGFASAASISAASQPGSARMSRLIYEDDEPAV